MKLRPYQEELIQRVYQSWESGNKNVLLQLPTGGGKSILFSTIVMDKAIHSAEKLPTAIMVHRKELVQQISLTLSSLGIMHNIMAPKATITGIIAAQRKRYGKSFYNFKSHVSVTSVDTLNARILRHKEWVKSIRLWITDEAAHLLKANKWGRAVSYFTDCIGLGVTATPKRLDKKGLGSHADGVFDHMVVGPGSRWLIQNGFLSRYKIVAPESDIANYLSKPSDKADYTRENMAEAAGKSQIVGDVVKNYLKFAKGKQAILFATDINTAKRIEENFNESGVPCKLLTGLSSDRERFDGIIDFEEKRIKVLVNVDLFDEGLDCLTMDTEILTPSGWKLYNQLNVSDKCFGWNSVTEKLEQVPIERIVKREVKSTERFWKVKSQHTDLKVTEGHNIYFKKKGYFWYLNKPNEVLKARELHEKRSPFILPISSEYNYKGLDILDDELRILGWYLTDGWLEGKGDARTTLAIGQTKEWGKDEIKKVLDRLGWHYKINKRIPNPKHSYPNSKPCVIFRIPLGHRKNQKGFKHIKHLFVKDIHPDLHNMTRNQFAILWESLMFGDGSKQKGKSGALCCARKKQVDAYMQLAVTRGFAAMYGTYLTDKGVTIYNLSVRDSKWLRFTPKDSRGAEFKLEKSLDENHVWCVTNRLGTIITRRNGKIAILGNCPNIEVVIMARPTMSLGKYLQMIGRGLRPYPDKEYTLLIDHVGNVVRHGLPCSPRKWTLDRVEKRKGNKSMIRICSNVECAAPYERELKECPWCGTPAIIMERGGRIPPDMVDGDLTLIDPESLIEMNSLTQLEDPARLAERVAHVAGDIAGQRALKNQVQRIEVQKELAESIARWAGEQKLEGLSDREIHKRYYLNFNETIAQSLSKPRSEMLEVIEKLQEVKTQDNYETTLRQMPMPTGPKVEV